MSAEPATEPPGTGRGWRVADAMSRDVVAVEATTTIAAALDLALASGRAHVVVVDDRGVLLDLVPLQVLSTALLARLVSRHQPIADAVVADPLSVGADADLDAAVEVMLAAGTDAVGVVDERGRVAGVVTWPDVGRLAAQPPRPTVPRPRGA